MTRSTITIAALLLAVAGCQDQQPVGEGGQGGPVEAQTASNEEAVSILRPDVAPPAAHRLEQLELRIGFPDGGAQLTPVAIESLQAAILSPQVSEGGAIILRGHSDAAGSDRANLDAARARTEAVQGWLIDNGIPADRISMIVFGEQNPIEPNALPDGTPNQAGRAANRRVDVTVLAPTAETAAMPKG